jgi:hypothetical protein
VFEIQVSSNGKKMPMHMEPPANPETMVRPMMTWLSLNTDHADMLAKGNTFIKQFPPEKALSIASAMSFANPFFAPDIPDGPARDLAVPLEGFAEFVMRAKLTIKHSPHPYVLVACAPKSASTFINSALIKGLQLPQACLFTAALDWASSGRLGASLSEQEPDELSLIRNGLNERGYVAQHHTRCSPYLARLLGVYNVKPIITHRNIADTVVSMDDMVMDWRARPNAVGYFADGMPSNFQHMPREDRLLMLAQRWTPWLVQFYVSWKLCERVGLTKPLWISYEKDFLGDKQVLAERIADYIGRAHADPAKIAAALEDTSNGAAKRINKGVAGRGKDVPAEVREYIDLTAGYYADDEDLTPLLGR